MFGFFGGGKKSADELEAEAASYREECATAMATMKELCQDLLDPAKQKSTEQDNDEEGDGDMGEIVSSGKLEIPEESTLQRFLNGYNHDPHVSAKKLRRMLKWRASYSYGLKDTLVRDINEATPGISFQIETGKCYILNKRDKCGRPIVVVHVRRHDQNKQSRDELTRYGIHVLERCTELLQEARGPRHADDDEATEPDKLNIIFNLQGIAAANIDMSAAKRIIYMLTHFYPERMGMCILLSAPIIFSAAWVVIRSFLSKRTQQKIQFCNPRDLTKWIEADALPVFWGGKDATVYSRHDVDSEENPLTEEQHALHPPPS